MKLLEEEEKEKREEEERKERRRTKEREKKLRRKERLKEKERDKGKRSSESSQSSVDPEVSSKDESSLDVDEEPNNITTNSDSVSETGDVVLSESLSPYTQDEQLGNGYITLKMQNHSHDDAADGECTNLKDGTGSFAMEHLKLSRRRMKFRKDFQLDPVLKWSDRRRYAVVSEGGSTVNKTDLRFHGDNFETPSRAVNGLNRQSRINAPKPNLRNCGHKFGEKFHCSNNRMSDRYDSHSCSCNQHSDYRAKVEPQLCTIRLGRDTKSVNKSESALDISKQFYRGNKYSQTDYARESCGRPKSKTIAGNNPHGNLPHTKKVWEPMESHKKYPRSSSDSDVTLRSSSFAIEEMVEPDNLIMLSDSTFSGEINCADNHLNESSNSSSITDTDCRNGFHVGEKEPSYSRDAADEVTGLSSSMTNPCSDETSELTMSSTSNSDNCSSCLSDSNTASSNPLNLESSSTSDSEDASQQSEGREISVCTPNGFPECHEVVVEKKQIENGTEAFRSKMLAAGFSPDGARNSFPANAHTKTAQNLDSGKPNITMGSQHQGMLPLMHKQNLHYPMFQAPSTMSYYHQNPVSWPAAPAAAANGLMPFPHPNHYLFTSPLGYGSSRLCMQYSALQHLTPPVLNPGQIPVYHPFTKANGVNSEEQVKIFKTGGAQEAFNEANKERVASAGPPRPAEVPPSGDDDVQNGNCAKLLHTGNGNQSFSLFHFGGPVALSTGNKVNPVPSNEGKVGDYSSKFSADHVDGDHACNKKEATIEEYNLFAASNGIRFSFF